MEDHAARNKRMALTVWGVSVAILLGPSLLVWIVRGAGYAVGCEPGPGLCRGMTLGGGLGDTLALAWSVGTDLLLLIVLTFAAMLAAFFARRPLLGTLSMLLLPILSLLLPMMAVYTAKYDDCPVSADGIGSCFLWGAPMGMSFHTAASAADLIFAITPYSFALAVMLGLVGWFFTRPKPPPAFTPLSAQMRHFGEEDN
jgi:hypothetical protein